VRHFVLELRTNPITVFLETVGTVSSMCASVLISLQLSSMSMVFMVWMLGSITMAGASYSRRNLMWLVLSLFYCIMNVIGFITWIS
jgi:hypothetical protein